MEADQELRVVNTDLKTGFWRLRVFFFLNFLISAQGFSACRLQQSMKKTKHTHTHTHTKTKQKGSGGVRGFGLGERKAA